MSAKEELLDTIERFLKRTGIPASVFGTEALGDPSLVKKLREGRTVRLDTAERLRTFMDEYRGVSRQKKASSGLAA